MRELTQVQGLRAAGDKVVLKREQGVCYQWKATGQRSRGDKCSFRHDGYERAKPTPKPLHPLSHQRQEVEVRREKGASEAGVRLGRPIDSHTKTSRKVLALNFLVTIGILPNVIFISQNRAVNSAKSSRFRTGKLRNNRIKIPKWVWQKWCSNSERCTTVGYRRTPSRRNF